MKGYGYELSALLSNITQCSEALQAITCSDSIPRIRKNNFVVINTSSSESPGKHWITVFNRNNEYLEIFDSLGCDFDFWSSKFSYCSKAVYNVTRLQSKDSSSCGLFAVYFIV